MRESYSSSPRASDPGYPIDHRADYGGDSERNSGNFVDGHGNHPPPWDSFYTKILHSDF
jgi:hypothetical protein